MALRLRRGTDAERVTSDITQGEIVAVFDLDPTKTNKVYLGDGSTPGGILVGPTTLLEESAPRLGGDLDLYGNDIIGTGNININGTITATGSINLGNGVEDSINVGGLISSSLNPALDDSYSLGSSSKQWANIWATQVNVDTTLAVGSYIIKLSTGAEDSNLVLWDAETDTLSAKSIIGNLVGSVFADDSIKLVDGVRGSLHTASMTIVDNTISTTDITNIAIDDTGLVISSGLAEGNFGLSIFGEGTSSGTSSSINIYCAGGTIAAPATVEAGDVIGTISFAGFNSNTYVPSAALALFTNQTATESSTTIDTTLALFVGNGSGDITDVGVSLNSNGVFSMPIAKVAGYETGSLPAGPEEGWMVFDSTTKEFKGWNGTAWVVLG